MLNCRGFLGSFFYDKRCWASSSELRNYGFKELRSRHRVVLRKLTLRSFRKIIGKRDLPEIAHAFEHCLLWKPCVFYILYIQNIVDYRVDNLYLWNHKIATQLYCDEGQSGQSPVTLAFVANASFSSFVIYISLRILFVTPLSLGIIGTSSILLSLNRGVPKLHESRDGWRITTKNTRLWIFFLAPLSNRNNLFEKRNLYVH